MSPAKTIVRNITANWVGVAARAVIAFFLTPYVLTKLGPVQFAVWAMVISLTGYYGLFNLGFRASLTQYITRYLALEDFDQMNRSASTGFFSCLCVGVVIMLLGAILSFIAPDVFEIPLEIATDVRWAIAISACGAALQFPFYVYTAVFPSTQRYDLANLIGITTRILQAMAIVLVLRYGHGLIGVAIAVFLTNLLDYLIRWRVAIRILPQISIQWSLVQLGSFREFISYGLWNSVINSATLIITQSDLILIGLMLPVAAVTPYALAAGLIAQINGILAPAAMVFFPVATHFHAQSKTDSLVHLFLHGSRFLFCVSALVVSVGIYHASSFFELWIDQGDIDSEFASPAAIFSVLAIATIIGAGKRVGNQVLMGAKLLRALACLTCCEAFCNVVISVGLAKQFGLIGIAYGTLVSSFILSLIGGAVVVCHYLKIDFRRYVITVLLRPVLFGVCVWLFCMLFDQILPPGKTWIWLLARGAFLTIVSIPLLFWIGFDRTDRSRFAPILRKLKLARLVA